MSVFDTIPVGFHFLVAFELFPQLPNDFSFMEITGLEAEMEMEARKEGGQNRFTHQLPVRTRYSDLVLKRGLFFESGITEWCRQGIENFSFTPTNILVSLLNPDHVPINNWYVVNAIPKKWQVSSFNAMENTLAIESLTLSYQYFNILTPAALLSAAVGAIGSAL
jgi:phage tail-like protein